MQKLIISCDNLKDEVNMICENLIKDKLLHKKPDIIWIDSKYHNYPEKLKEQLQDIINNNKKYEIISLLYGQCGNAVIDIKSDYSKLIIPKVSDCISLYLGGNKKRKDIQGSEKSYFFTKRYIENKDSLYNEMLKMKEKYGQKKAIKMYKMMMNNYDYIKVIDTNTYEVSDIINKIQYLCEELNLSYEVVKGDLSIIEKILLNIIDNEFIVKEKGEMVSNEDFYN